jgi:hypothetical protein
MQSEESVQPAKKAQWEPMRLTPVGNLGSIMQGGVGSKNDGGGTFNKLA